METGAIFSRLMADYGGTQTPKEETEKPEEKKKDTEKAEGIPAAAKPLMQEEDRNTGQMKWGVYGTYVKAGGGVFWGLIIVIGLLAEQGAQSEYTCSYDSRIYFHSIRFFMRILI